MKIQYLTKKPDCYNFREFVYVWDDFLSYQFSDFLDEMVYMHTNWRYCNRVVSPECCHTLWGRTYTEERPEYINQLTSILESKTGIKIPSFSIEAYETPKEANHSKRAISKYFR